MLAHDHAAQGAPLDWLPLILTLLLTLAYLAGAYGQRRKPAGWSVWRSLFLPWAACCLAPLWRRR